MVPSINHTLFRQGSGPLCIGGRFESAQDLAEKGVVSQFRVKFFIQSTVWPSGELERQRDEGAWLTATCDREVLLKIRERVGTDTKVLEVASSPHFTGSGKTQVKSPS